MKNDKPKQYTQGFVEFFKLKFKVTPAVLIPRPETELLVDLVLQIKPSTLLDIGTGAGNIAISAAKNLPTLKVTASDISKEALKVAKQNARFHKVTDRIEFIQADLLEPIWHDIARYEVIVANLPYIPTERIPYLDSSVKDFEPYIALNGGKDGFELYRKLFKQIKSFEAPIPDWKLKYLFAEIDYTQAEIAVNEALKFFPKSSAEVKLDLAHKQRILIIKF